MKSYRRIGQTLDEQSPVQSSQSNGEAERTVQNVEGRIGTLVSAFEKRIDAALSPEDSIAPWLAIHAGHLLATFDVRDNGKTPDENLRCKKLSIQVMNLANSIIFCHRIAMMKSSSWQSGMMAFTSASG